MRRTLHTLDRHGNRRPPHIGAGATPAEKPEEPPPPPGKARGTIQHTYPARGFGFIRCTAGAPDDIGYDFFFHTSGLEEGLDMVDLLPGQVVEFETREVPRGKRAENVAIPR